MLDSRTSTALNQEENNKKPQNQHHNGPQSTPIARLLPRLEGVRQRTKSSWSALCPAHPDRNPSLAVSVKPDDVVLLKCFSGCEAFEVMEAVGLEPRDLFPEASPDRLPAERQPFPAATLLHVIANEAMKIHIAGVDISEGRELTATDRQQVGVSATRIYEALRAGGL